MFLTILKKEVRQVLRAKKTFVFMFIFPIVLITTLSIGLKDMMASEDIFGSGSKYSKVYYTIHSDSKYTQGFYEFKKGVEEAVNIKFEETPSLDEVKDEVDKYDALAHIDITSSGYKIYSSKNGESIKTKVFVSIFESVPNEYAAYETIDKYNPEAFRNLIRDEYDEYVMKKDVYGARDITSYEYYTFAELALIIFYVSNIVGESVYMEFSFRTINRIRLSKAKTSHLIGVKILVGVIISLIQILIVYIYSSKVLKVNWGENTLKFMSMFLVFGLFASVVGAVFGGLSKDGNSVWGFLNIITIIICFLGGCYVPLSVIINVSPINKLIYLSPIYWINSAISSMLCGIESNVYFIALGVPLGLSAVFLLVYFIIINKGRVANA